MERNRGLVEQYPDEAQLFFRLALARSALGDKAQAIATMTRAIELFPGEPAYYYSRALWRTDGNALSDAATDFREAIRLEEQLGSVYYIDSARMGLAVACCWIESFARRSTTQVRLRVLTTVFTQTTELEAGEMLASLASSERLAGGLVSALRNAGVGVNRPPT